MQQHIFHVWIVVVVMMMIIGSCHGHGFNIINAVGMNRKMGLRVAVVDHCCWIVVVVVAAAVAGGFVDGTREKRCQGSF